MKTIRELITGRTPMTMEGSATALEAARRMKEEHVGAVLVVDDSQALCGVFTERDLMTRIVVAGLAPDEVRLEDVMTRELFTASPDQRVNEVAREMQSRHIRHLPVVEDGTTVAMLSLRDLLREHLDAKRNEVRALTAYIQGEEASGEA